LLLSPSGGILNDARPLHGGPYLGESSYGNQMA
jgi:hypothetical protein